MPDIELVARGIAIGLVVAAPIGPVNLICIRRTLSGGFVRGFLSGLGAALGDGIFAAIAAFGFTAAIDAMMSYADWLQLGGGIFLIVLGIRTFVAHPHIDMGVGDAPPTVAMARVFVTAFFLTITNPATMLGFLAIFSSVAGFTPRDADYASAATLVGAVVGGSIIWWACITGFVSLFRQKMNDHMLEWLNHIAGVLIIVFGLGVLVRLAANFIR
ncbi:MAG: LysE family translocator [Parvibaculaceae bacterium]|nr:LysE family translocator [Parvibaculaceae bacterium]